jgi:hypothetical protein
MLASRPDAARALAPQTSTRSTTEPLTVVMSPLARTGDLRRNRPVDPSHEPELSKRLKLGGHVSESAVSGTNPAKLKAFSAAS